MLYEHKEELEVIGTVDELNTRLDSEGIDSLAQQLEKDGFSIITLAFDKHVYYFYYDNDNPQDYWICKVPKKPDIVKDMFYQTSLN